VCAAWHGDWTGMAEHAGEGRLAWRSGQDIVDGRLLVSAAAVLGAGTGGPGVCVRKVCVSA
jgi:hypothetical protein